MKNRHDPQEMSDRLSKASGTERPNGRSRGKQPRANQKMIGSWHDPVVRQQLKALALETDKTEQKLMQEAINLVFAKYGKPQIA